jgi:hypothetical protein
MSEPTTPATASEPAMDQHEIRFTCTRLGWLRTQWAALFFWSVVGGLVLLPIALSVRQSWWWLCLLPVWFVLGGRQLVGILIFLVRGKARLIVYVTPTGHAMGVSEDGGRMVLPLDDVRFEDQGTQWLLVANSGRVQLPIPKTALTAGDIEAVRRLRGVELAAA